MEAPRIPAGREDTAVVSDTSRYIRGKHSFKFGADRRFYNNNFNGDTGTLTFNNVTDFVNGQAIAFAITPGNLPSRISTVNSAFFAQGSGRCSSG